MKLPSIITDRIKAVAAGVGAAVVSYIATAIATGSILTVHGLEVAAATAVLTALGVHQAPANTKAK